MKNKSVLIKMVNYVDVILAYTKNVEYAEFSNNRMLVEACVFNLSQIGELVTKLDMGFRDRHENIPWKRVKGLRDRIVHDYEGVDLQLIWEVIRINLVPLRMDILNIISKIG